jgi:tetraacyldisaccharide 4'-kinase
MEAQFRNIVSAESPQLGATALRAALAAIAAPYQLTVAVRNWLYDAGMLRSHRVAVPVVSIGNITLGGTGKTPFVELICRWFLARQKRPVILSRGYRSSGRANDEAMLLAANLPDVPHLQGKDRVLLARNAVRPETFGNVPDVLVLDDGFQHRRLARDLDIVLIDCTEPFGYSRIFPRGMLREPIGSLRRADLIVLSRADQCTPEDLASIEAQVVAGAGKKPMVRAEHRPTALRSADGTRLPVATLAGRSVAAFCGIGNPRAFEKSLGRLSCSILAVRSFPDHHAYSNDDLKSLADWASELRCDWIITTQKDLVKIPHSSLGSCPLFALQIEAVVDDPSRHLDRALSSLVQSQEGTSRHAA